MRRPAIFLLFALVFAGCNKLPSDAVLPNTDVTGNIFRVVANSDVDYLVSVIISSPGKATADTLSIESEANFQFSYGFHAVDGMVITVNASTKAGATTLQCQPLYKSVALGPVTFTDNANGSKNASFTYSVIDSLKE